MGQLIDKTVLNEFLGEEEKKVDRQTLDGSREKEVCDAQTGECYVLREKDGLVERINKKFITEDGRQLLSD